MTSFNTFTTPEPQGSLDDRFVNIFSSLSPPLTPAESVMEAVSRAPPTDQLSRIASARSSVIDSIRGCGLAGVRIDKEDLRRKIVIPLYLRKAVSNAIRCNDAYVDVDNRLTGVSVGAEVPECPIVVFINSRSGGRHGPELMVRLQELICEEQVFDLQKVKPDQFVQHGLRCLEVLALRDECAKETRQRLRVVVAGGDGTVGWVLDCLGRLWREEREPVPPIAIIPLGTGNDLSRSFGWGGSFPFAWKSAIKRTLYKAIGGPISRLDSWQAHISMPADGLIDPPHSLKIAEEVHPYQNVGREVELPEKVTYFEGKFYNYFSIGMDAQIAYGFHHLRNERPYLAQGPISNKLIYSGYTCKQGWFLTPCMGNPSLRGLNNILRMYIQAVGSLEWEQIPVPSNVRAIVALNLHSYASGRNPWGNLTPEYLEKRGFVKAQVDDGVLEIFGLKQGWHASLVMVELIPAKHIAQAGALKFEIRGGEWEYAFMQMDGEPWKQRANRDYSTYVVINRVPYHSIMVNASPQ